MPDDGHRFGDGPLGDHGERRLARLLADPGSPGPSRPSPPSSPCSSSAAPRPRPRSPRPARCPSWPTPRPSPWSGSPSGPPPPPGPKTPPRRRRGTHVQSWSLGMSHGEPPVTLPQERILRWTPDGRHTELVVATDPRHPGRPVLTDEGGEPRLVDDGRVTGRRTFPPSWSDAPPAAHPPHDPTRLRAYLAETANDPLRTTPELLDAAAQLLDNWTLGARESAALTRLLADAGGLRPTGRVTDRLGRPGQAYVYDNAPGIRHMLILDPSDGAVLGLEETFTTDQPEYGVRAGDVMQYRAWIR
ncbi:CU044_5270 family protein [Streptomyces fungicidicus]|uniref:CU044_5270 family protein n=1 Tax=Streptomyces fungicidicus TaxID=68203 RepID=UPI003683AAA4